MLSVLFKLLCLAVLAFLLLRALFSRRLRQTLHLAAWQAAWVCLIALLLGLLWYWLLSDGLP